MRVQLLRGVALEVDPGIARLPSEKVRSLLAALAWQPGEVVPDDTVIERIWGRWLPRHPRDSLYTCANRLRALMQRAVPGTERSISRLREGYVFSIDPQSVDLHRFRSLSRRAHAAMRTDECAKAVSLFNEGLDLWGQTALPDLGTEWAERVRVTLDAERLAAQISRAEAALRAGRNREEVPRLQQLADRYPLDETIAGLLMVALSRSGRGSEALAHFRGIRGRTLREMGDEPGQCLQHLHERILRRDAELEHVLPAASHP